MKHAGQTLARGQESCIQPGSSHCQAPASRLLNLHIMHYALGSKLHLTDTVAFMCYSEKCRATAYNLHMMLTLNRACCNGHDQSQRTLISIWHDKVSTAAFGKGVSLICDMHMTCQSRGLCHNHVHSSWQSCESSLKHEK